MKPPPLTPGLHWVDLPCPRCGSIETVAVSLSSVLTTPADDQPSLKLRCKSKATDHDCGQGRMLDTSDLLPIDTSIEGAKP